MHRIAIFAALLFFLPFLSLESAAQDQLNARFGVGTGATVSTQDGIGLNFHGRASAPINQDVSAAVDMGLTGYILGGTADATYIFSPQLSAIVNLPMQGDYLPYIIGGVGAHVPVAQADNSLSGPTLHLGIGRVHPLQESSIYYEINPALLISENRLDVIVPIRLGLIFR